MTRTEWHQYRSQLNNWIPNIIRTRRGLNDNVDKVLEENAPGLIKDEIIIYPLNKKHWSISSNNSCRTSVTY